MNAIQVEAMLLRWAETSNGGATITLLLSDPDDLEPFRAMTLARKDRNAPAGMAGQRLMLAVVQIGDDELPVDKPKGGPLAQLAGRWCQDEQFQAWLGAAEPDKWRQWATAYPEAGPQTIAAYVVRDVCAVLSRADLDHDANAARIFHNMIRVPFQAYLEATR